MGCPLKHRLLCGKCLIDDGFFTGGGSWAPDSCPKCGGTACVMYDKLSIIKQIKAQRLNDKLWDERWEIEKHDRNISKLVHKIFRR